jgi:hypothetical protein
VVVLDLALQAVRDGVALEAQARAALGAKGVQLVRAARSLVRLEVLLQGRVKPRGGVKREKK